MGRYPRPLRWMMVAIDVLNRRAPFLAPRKALVGPRRNGASMNCIEQGQSVSLCANRVNGRIQRALSVQHGLDGHCRKGRGRFRSSSAPIWVRGNKPGSDFNGTPTLVGKIEKISRHARRRGMDDPLGAIKLRAALRRSRAVFDPCVHHGSSARYRDLAPPVSSPAAIWVIGATA